MRGLCVTSSLKVRTLSYREDLQPPILLLPLYCLRRQICTQRKVISMKHVKRLTCQVFRGDEKNVMFREIEAFHQRPRLQGQGSVNRSDILEFSSQCWKQCHQQEAKTHTYKLEGGERCNCNRELEKLVGFWMAFVICTILSRAPDLSHSTLCFKRHFKLLVWVCWWGLKACGSSFSARLQCL